MSVIIMSVNRRAGGWLEHKVVFRARFLVKFVVKKSYKHRSFILRQEKSFRK